MEYSNPEMDAVYSGIKNKLARPWRNTFESSVITDFKSNIVEVKENVEDYPELYDLDNDIYVSQNNYTSQREGFGINFGPLGCVGNCGSSKSQPSAPSNNFDKNASLNAANAAIAASNAQAQMGIAASQAATQTAAINAQSAYAQAKLASDNQIAALNTLAQQSSNQLAATESSNATMGNIAAAGNAALVDNTKLLVASQTDQMKIQAAQATDLVNIANLSAEKRAAIEAQSRDFAVQQQTAMLMKQSDNAVAMEMARSNTDIARINADTAADIATAQANSKTTADVAKANAIALDAVSKNAGEGIANALGVTLGPNGIAGILGQVSDITANQAAQQNRMLTELTRQSVLQQQINAQMQQQQLDSLLAAQQQQRLLDLQAAKKQSEQVITVLKELPPVSEAKDAVKKVTAKVVVSAISRCKASIDAGQSIKGINIGGENNQVNLKQKQTISFSLNCVVIKDIQQQIKERLDGFKGLGVEVSEQTITMEDLNEMMADFKASQEMSDLKISGSGNIVNFDQEQTLDLLMSSAEKVTKKFQVDTVAGSDNVLDSVSNLSISWVTLLIIFIFAVIVGYFAKIKYMNYRAARPQI